MTRFSNSPYRRFPQRIDPLELLPESSRPISAPSGRRAGDRYLPPGSGCCEKTPRCAAPMMNATKYPTTVISHTDERRQHNGYQHL